MLLLILTIINFLLGGFDAWLSLRRMRLFGLAVELNDAIRWLSAILGKEFGVVLGIAVPVTAQCVLCLMFHWTIILALLVGFRVRLFVDQLNSFKLEAALLKEQRKLDE